MKRALIVAALAAAFQAESSGQEVLLKDGKKVPWKALAHAGAGVEITKPDGEKIMVKVDAIEKVTMVPGGDVAAPLTGATITFDKKKIRVTDLLSTVDPKKNAFMGEWKAAAGALVSLNPGTQLGRFVFDQPVPEEYDLTIIAERTSGDGFLGVGLIGGGQQFLFAFDAFKKICGIWVKDGKGADQSGDAKMGPFFTNGQPREITFMVRKEGFVVRAGDRDFYSWTGDWKTLSLMSQHGVPSKNSVFLISSEAEYKFRKASIAVPK